MVARKKQVGLNLKIIIEFHALFIMIYWAKFYFEQTSSWSLHLRRWNTALEPSAFEQIIYARKSSIWFLVILDKRYIESNECFWIISSLFLSANHSCDFDMLAKTSFWFIECLIIRFAIHGKTLGIVRLSISVLPM